MKVVIIRHAEVDLTWSKRSTSEEFDAECRMYDEAPIKKNEYEIPQMEFQKIYISALPRTRATAESLFPDRKFTSTKLINEVPLGSSFDSKKKRPLWFWNVSGRLQWFINSPRQQEGKNETRKRARRFIKAIVNADEDCAVVSHGFFMHTLIQELKKSGFKVDNNHSKFKNGECVIATKN